MRRTWYRLRHGIAINIDRNGSMLPQLGRGRFVSVIRRGNFIDIRNEGTGEIIRLIPYQPNHGVMVEHRYPDGRGEGRTHCDFQRFKQMLTVGQEISGREMPPNINEMADAFWRAFDRAHEHRGFYESFYAGYRAMRAAQGSATNSATAAEPERQPEPPQFHDDRPGL